MKKYSGQTKMFVMNMADKIYLFYKSWIIYSIFISFPSWSNCLGFLLFLTVAFIFVYTCDIQMSFWTFSFLNVWPSDFCMSPGWRYSSMFHMRNNDGNKSEFINVFLIVNSYHWLHSSPLKIYQHFVPITDFLFPLIFNSTEGKVNSD